MSTSITQELTQALAASEGGRLYALVDPAQDAGVIQRIAQDAAANACLFGYALDSPIAKATPRLVSIDNLENSSLFKWIDRHASHAPIGTLMISQLPLRALTEHLQQQMNIKLQDVGDMFLAFWDASILGTLVGQADDETLHVAGPVLDAEQLQDFLSPLAAWWYCDREGHWHKIAPPATGSTPGDAPPLALTQAQEDMLVEAGVPDQVLHHLELNCPTLFDEQPSRAKRYRFVRAVLDSARMLGLEGMRDLVNFVALCLIYRRRMQTDPEIVYLLGQVERKSITLDEAMAHMPE